MPPGGPSTSASVPRASLRRGTLAVLGGNGLLNAARLLVVVLLAKFGSAEVLGQYTYGVALTGPLVLFCSLELRGVLVADASGRFPFAAYRALRSLGLVVAAVILAVILAVKWSAGGQSVLFLLLAGVAAARLALYWAEIDWGIYQKHDRLDLYGWSNALRGLAVLVPFALLLPLGGRLGPDSAPAGAWAATLATGVHAVLWWALAFAFDRRNLGRLGTPRDTCRAGTVAQLAWHALPLGAVSLIVSLCENLPRLVIEAQPDGRAALGYFGAIAAIPAVAQFVVVQLGIASSHRLATSYRTDPPGFRRLVLKLVALSALGAAVLLVLVWVFGGPMLRIAFQPEYVRHLHAFRILAAASGLLLMASILGFVTTQMGVFRLQVPVQLAVLVVTAGCAFVLIPTDPITGAAWTALARGATQAGLYLLCVLYGMARRPALREAPVPAPLDAEI